MAVFSSKKESHRILNNLRARFEDGERITINQIIKENFKVLNPLYLDIAKRKVAAWIVRVSQQYNMAGEMFGRLNERGEYGFPDNEAEARFLGTRKYILGKGYMHSAVRVMKNGMTSGLLKGKEESNFLLKPTNGEK